LPLRLEAALVNRVYFVPFVPIFVFFVTGF